METRIVNKVLVPLTATEIQACSDVVGTLGTSDRGFWTRLPVLCHVRNSMIYIVIVSL